MLISDSVFVRLILTSIFGNLESMMTMCCQLINSSGILINTNTGYSRLNVFLDGYVRKLTHINVHVTGGGIQTSTVGKRVEFHTGIA